jgi:uncharacterized membrane protein
MRNFTTRIAKSAKARHALTLLGVVSALVATAVVFAATRGGDFTMKVSSPKQSITAGKSASFPVKIKRLRGFKGAVKLTVSGLPRGARASWKAGSKRRVAAAAAGTVIKKSQKSATLTIVTSAGTRIGSFKPTITAKSGRIKHKKKIQLTVRAAPTGGGSGGTPTPTTPATPAETTFAVDATPTARSVVNGDSTSFDVSINRAGGYTGAVALTVTGEPAGTTATFTPASTSGTSSTLAIDTSPTTSPGAYNLVVTGSGGGKTASKALSLVVQQTQSFGISGDLIGQLAPGATQALALSVQNPNDFPLHVTNLTVSDPPTIDKPGCLPSWFTVSQFSGSYANVVVPAKSTRTLTALGVAQTELPQVAMTDDPTTDQEDCKGATLEFSYSGSATK